MTKIPEALNRLVPREREDLSFLDRYSPREISNWLVKGFHSNYFEGYSLPRKVDYWETGLTYLFYESSVREKQLFSAGIVYALEHWGFKPDYNEALANMTNLVNRLRASDGIPALIRMIDAESIHGKNADDVRQSVVFTIISADPTPHIKKTLERWFYDDAFNPKYAGLLLNGLLNNVPGDFRRNFKRFVEIETTITGYLDLRFIVAMFENYNIDLRQIENTFREIADVKTRSRYLKALREFQAAEKEFKVKPV